MKIVLKKNGPNSFEVDPVDKPGSPAVGRGKTMLEAFGNFLICYQEELGLNIVVDASARATEMARRRREMGKR
jgi:hypothetical protein